MGCLILQKKYMDYKVLLVDDEEDILNLLSYNFTKEGYKVFTASNGKDAIEAANKHLPEVIVLDVMLPDIDGIEVCESLRKNPDLNKCYILFLSARGEDYSQVAGYRAGGDDYILKPDRIRVLLHKIKALLDRDRELPEPIQSKSFVVDIEKYSITKDGKEIIIPKKEFELLTYLMTDGDKVFRREDILSNVWGDITMSDRTIDVHVRKLRERFGSEIIRTVKGVGYRYMG